MQAYQRSRSLLRQVKVVRFVTRTSLVTVFGLLIGVTALGAHVMSTNSQARTICASTNHVYRGEDNVRRGSIAAAYHHSTQPILSDSNQKMCMPGRGYSEDKHMRAYTDPFGVAELQGTQAIRTGTLVQANSVTNTIAGVEMNYAVSKIAAGNSNPFPYGQCTWWADQRYFQMNGVFVPWKTGANAGQWTGLASQFGWSVSATPRVGMIIVLQPGVQGAYAMGHVGVVEKVLGNGRVTASSMNWGANPMAVTDWQFTVGPGVAFIGT